MKEVSKGLAGNNTAEYVSDRKDGRLSATGLGLYRLFTLSK